MWCSIQLTIEFIPITLPSPIICISSKLKKEFTFLHIYLILPAERSAPKFLTKRRSFQDLAFRRAFGPLSIWIAVEEPYNYNEYNSLWMVSPNLTRLFPHRFILQFNTALFSMAMSLRSAALYGSPATDRLPIILGFSIPTNVKNAQY